MSCGIPDFRSPGGFYEKMAQIGIDPPELIFDLDYFTKDPKLFYTHGSLIMPSDIKPSRTHRFIAKLDAEGKLLRNYTQNIDGLEVKVWEFTKLAFFSFSLFSTGRGEEYYSLSRDVGNRNVHEMPEEISNVSI